MLDENICMIRMIIIKINQTASWGNTLYLYYWAILELRMDPAVLLAILNYPLG